MADLQRLLTLSGHEVTGNEDTVVIEQLIAGLSPEFARSLSMAMAGKTLKIDECVEKVRALRATTGEFKGGAHGDSVAAAAMSGQVKPSSSILCYHCGEVGHIRRNCPAKHRGGGGGLQREQTKFGGKKTMCFFL